MLQVCKDVEQLLQMALTRGDNIARHTSELTNPTKHTNQTMIILAAFGVKLTRLASSGL
jgi:hypothetical protein